MDRHTNSKFRDLVETNLPELRSTYHESYGGSGGFMGPAYQGGKKITPVPPTPRPPDTSRLEYLESRMESQERAAQSLLDRAMKIKEDVIENLNLTHSSWQGEKRQRELLQDHIRAITDLVKKMDRDIRYLEDQIRTKDNMLLNTGSSVKAIELQQATSITDIRGRISRCDAAISKLASDQQAIQDGIKLNANSQLDQYHRLQDKLQALEVKLAESKQTYETKATESLSKAQSKEDDSYKAAAALEIKLESSVEELRTKMFNSKQREESERQRLLAQVNLTLEKSEVATRDKIDRLEQRLDSAWSKINKDIEELKYSVSEIKDLRRNQIELERKLTVLIERATRQHEEKMTSFKSECRQGFATIQEALTSSKHVLEAKIALSEEQLRKEISHIKRMVVVV